MKHAEVLRLVWVGRGREVRVYRSARGWWVLGVVHRTIWRVRVADDPDSLRRAINDLVPKDLRGEVLGELGLH